MDVRVVGGVVVGLVVVCSIAFLAQPAADPVRPAEFDDTLTMGMSGVDVRAAEERGYALSRAQVFYGQYQYVIGYYGVESLVEHLGRGTARRQFGEPLAVFVTDFSGTDPTLTDDGNVVLGDELRRGWVRARAAQFVVGSRARTLGGPTVLSFGDRVDARTFADRYGGRVVTWETLKSSDTARDRDIASRFRGPVADQSAWADRTVAGRERLRQRPVSVVVGDDAPTLAAALEQAPPNTTVQLPSGRYDGKVSVEKPLTIRGSGPETVLAGDGNTTVLTVRSDRVAVTSLSVTGVGSTSARSPSAGNASRWEDRTLRVYGRSDAAILFATSNESLVADVRVDTQATGVLLRFSDRTVVRNVTIAGAATPDEGSMGVLPMYSRVVVERTTVRGGRDGVYTHRADGSVIRDNDLADMRYGVHEMFTSSLLIRNTSVRETNTGMIMMTNPTTIRLVDNRVTASEVGIFAVGDTSYVAGNVVVDNDLGMDVATTRSLVANNTAVGNDVGLRAGRVIPSNHVVGNDVLDNARPVETSRGPIHVWTVDGEGNYWGQVPGRDRDGDGLIDRPYRPGDRVDVTAADATGGPTLVRSPSLALLRRASGSVPGLRDAGILDTAPRTDPSRPTVLREVRNETDD
jgi:nitrous oxidase accessory protein NosD